MEAYELIFIGNVKINNSLKEISKQDREVIYSLALDKVLSKDDSHKLPYYTVPEYIRNFIGESVTKRKECMLEMNDKTFTLYHKDIFPKTILSQHAFHSISFLFNTSYENIFGFIGKNQLSGTLPTPYDSGARAAFFVEVPKTSKVKKSPFAGKSAKIVDIKTKIWTEYQKISETINKKYFGSPSSGSLDKKTSVNNADVASITNLEIVLPSAGRNPYLNPQSTNTTDSKDSGYLDKRNSQLSDLTEYLDSNSASKIISDLPVDQSQLSEAI